LGAGSAPVGLVAQDDLADGGEFAEQFPYRQIRAAAAGAEAHQVGEADTLLRHAHQRTRLARGAAIALVR